MHPEGASRNIKGQHHFVTKTYFCNKKSKKLTMGVVHWPALMLWWDFCRRGHGVVREVCNASRRVWRNIKGQRDIVPIT
jgi:hypothetical protein